MSFEPHHLASGRQAPGPSGWGSGQRGQPAQRKPNPVTERRHESILVFSFRSHGDLPHNFPQGGYLHG